MAKRRRKQRVTTRTVSRSTRVVTKNPLQAGTSRYIIVAVRGIGKHKQTLRYDGAKFTKRGRAFSFKYKAEADSIRRQIQRRYGPALRGWDVLTK